jgi:hypothetical protein
VTLESEKNKILGNQWVAIPRDMNSCPAWHALAASPSALRSLWRIQEEHMAHGGYENGKLPVTYEDFERWGVRPDSIAGAIRELEALGTIEVTQRGYRGAEGKRSPNLYRLTYLPTWDAGNESERSGAKAVLGSKTRIVTLATGTWTPLLGKSARHV